MPTISRSALLPYAADALYDLVNDVAAYPDFMDGCVGAEVLAKGEDYMEARLDLAKAGLRQSFTTRNTLHPKSRIDLNLLDGPFESLSGSWLFETLSPNACKVTLDLHFTMRRGILAAATGRLFESVANNLVDAVTRRAKYCYG